MSESAKKKFVQKKLPFAIVLVDKDKAPATTPTENLSPNVAAVSRKRKTSNEATQVRPKKRVTESKDNPSVSEVVDLGDSEDEPPTLGSPDEDQNDKSLCQDSEKTPTSTPIEKIVHIKLPSCSKLKKRINMDVKPQQSLSEEDFDADDSVVHLEKEILIAKKSKKRAKKSEKKKKKKGSAGDADAVKKAILMSPPAAKHTEDKAEDDESPNSNNAETVEDSNKSEPDIVEIDDDLPVEATEEGAVALKGADIDKPAVREKSSQNSDAVNSLINGDIIESGVANGETGPSNAMETDQKSSPADDSINEELIEMLSDDSESSAKNNSLNCGGAFNTPTSSKFDAKNLTPKQLARRQEQMAKRAEKDLQRQKEREVKEQLRLKEKEAREEAKRKEKEDRDKKRQAEQDKKDEEKRAKEEEKKVGVSFLVVQ